jgi:WD40 repeat protein
MLTGNHNPMSQRLQLLLYTHRASHPLGRSQSISVVRWGDMSVDNPRIGGKVTAIASSPVHQSLIAAGTDTGFIGLFHNTGSIDSSPHRAMLRFPVRDGVGPRGDKHLVTGLQFLEEHILVSSSRDGTVRLWDCTNMSQVNNVLNITSRDSVTALAVISSSTIIVTGSAGGYVNVRDIRFNSGELDKGMHSRTSSISALAVCANDFEITAADADGHIDVWDMRSTTNIPLLSLNGHETVTTAGRLNVIPPIGPKTSTKSVISEDIWDVAMGKKRKQPSLSKDYLNYSDSIRPPLSSLQAPAHKAKVLALGRIDSGIIGSVSVDKSAKAFCRLTGNLLGVYKLKEKPMCASFRAGVICIGKREGFGVVDSIVSPVISSIDNSSTHVGSVHATAFVGDWGICTGGADHHIFVHRIEF